VAYPFQKTFYVIGKDISNKLNFLKSIRNLQEDNRRLTKENYNLLGQLAVLKDEKQENEKLREQLNLAPRIKFNLEASLVIGQDPQKLGNWLLIDKGSSNGIEEGMPVIAYEGILIGKIKEVTASSAQVELLSYATSAVNAVDLETEAKGIIRGEYGLGIIMDMISQKDLVNKGDTIVTSGLGSDIPRGLLIGEVQEINPSPDKLFQQAAIMPKIKYSDLELIFVIKN
jgi:rod shape-determining protein MreC